MRFVIRSSMLRIALVVCVLVLTGQIAVFASTTTVDKHAPVNQGGKSLELTQTETLDVPDWDGQLEIRFPDKWAVSAQGVGFDIANSKQVLTSSKNTGSLPTGGISAGVLFLHQKLIAQTPVLKSKLGNKPTSEAVLKLLFDNEKQAKPVRESQPPIEKFTANDKAGLAIAYTCSTCTGYNFYIIVIQNEYGFAVGLWSLKSLTIASHKETMRAIVANLEFIPADESASTPEPTKKPAKTPTKAPTKAPTKTPTTEPTEESAEESTEEPTEELTEEPTKKPARTPTKAPTKVPTKTPTKESAEEPTEEPAVTGLQPGDTKRPTSGKIVTAYCDEPDYEQAPAIKTSDSVYLYFGWRADTEDQVWDWLDTATITITLDKKPVRDDWPNFASPIEQGDDGYTVSFYVPLGKLKAGDHKIVYKTTYSKKIYDGKDYYGPGSDHEEESYTCSFHVD